MNDDNDKGSFEKRLKGMRPNGPGVLDHFSGLTRMSDSPPAGYDNLIAITTRKLEKATTPQLTELRDEIHPRIKLDLPNMIGLLAPFKKCGHDAVRIAAIRMSNDLTQMNNAFQNNTQPAHHKMHASVQSNANFREVLESSADEIRSDFPDFDALSVRIGLFNTALTQLLITEEMLLQGMVHKAPKAKRPDGPDKPDPSRPPTMRIAR